MIRLLLTGIAASFFFSSTFVLNRAMSLEGGSWVWSSSLRFGYMILFLSIWISAKFGPRMLGDVFRTFIRHWLFWIIAGTVGFGLFYAPLCLASGYAPGWVIASTWQFTLIAGILVFPLFGKRIPIRGLLTSLLIFGGILLINLSSIKTGEIRSLFWGIAPILLAAFSYPIGNQMVGEAKHHGYRRIPKITGPAMSIASGRVLLMCLGSVPFWVALVLFAFPGPPSQGQLFQTAIVALCSGVIATSLFLHARHSSSSPMGIAATDASQAAEIVFALLLEMAFLKGNPPTLIGCIGLIMVLAGLIAYSKAQLG